MWKPITISLDEDTIELLRTTSRETDIPMSRLVKRAILEMYGEEDEETKVTL